MRYNYNQNSIVMGNIFKYTILILSSSLLSAFIVYKFVKDSELKVSVEHTPKPRIVQTNYPVNAHPSIDFTQAAEQSMSAVVHIKSSTVKKISPHSHYNPFREFFGDDFFGPHMQQPNPQVRVGTGSGVIIDQAGYIVTNYHVIQNADDIEISLNDNRNYKAEIVGIDPSTDLAVLKIEEENLPFLTLQNSDDVKVGQWVLAVGNPFDLNSTVTAGIVSAKARNINIIKGNSAIESFIQTDAAVNPGNSGGALVNLNGELVGINTAIASPTGAYSGYAFAVPSNIVSKVVEDLIEFGSTQRAYLGVIIRNVDATLKQEIDLDLNQGVYIQEVMPGSSADQSGIKQGDVIIEIEDKPTPSVPSLQEQLSAFRPGDKVVVKLKRDKKDKVIEVVLKNKDGKAELLHKEEMQLMRKLGIELTSLNNAELKELELENGVRISKIYNGKIARETNIKEGFIITKIGDQKVKSKNDIITLLQNKNGGILIEGRYPSSQEIYYYGLGL